MKFLLTITWLTILALTKAQITQTELQAHSTTADCWTAVDGVVYDISGYAARHPSSSGVIEDMCGAEASTQYNSRHRNKGYIENSANSVKGNYEGPPGSTSNTGISGFCFSEKATVHVFGKGKVTMKELMVGDKILVPKKKNGVSAAPEYYEPVYAFAHREPEKTTNFLQIHTQAATTDVTMNVEDKPLEMTGEHLVFLKDKRIPVRADSIQVGDVLVPDNTVTKIMTVQRKGLFAPLTPSGTLMVDGIKASSYISLQDHANEYVELKGDRNIKTITMLAQQDLIHMTLAPFRLVCSAMLGGDDHYQMCASSHKNENGMPYFVAGGLKVAKWLDDSMDSVPLLLQIMLLATFVTIMIVFVGIEIIFGLFGAYGLAAAGIMLVAIKNKAKKIETISVKKNV